MTERRILTQDDALKPWLPELLRMVAPYVITIAVFVGLAYAYGRAHGWTLVTAILGGLFFGAVFRGTR